jgi:anti-sigma B factor antagonist
LQRPYHPRRRQRHDARHRARPARQGQLNLGDVNYIDSSGIGELVSAFTTTKNQGGELKLLNLTKKVHDLLQITKLYTVFDVKEDETAAVKGFK